MTWILASNLFCWMIWTESWIVANEGTSEYDINIYIYIYKIPWPKMTKGPTIKYLIWTTQRQHITVVDIPQIYIYIYNRIIIRSVMNVDAVAIQCRMETCQLRLHTWKELSINLAYLIRKLIVYRHDSLIMSIMLWTLRINRWKYLPNWIWRFI